MSGRVSDFGRRKEEEAVRELCSLHQQRTPQGQDITTGKSWLEKLVIKI